MCNGTARNTTPCPWHCTNDNRHIIVTRSLMLWKEELADLGRLTRDVGSHLHCFLLQYSLVAMVPTEPTDGVDYFVIFLSGLDLNIYGKTVFLHILYLSIIWQSHVWPSVYEGQVLDLPPVFKNKVAYIGVDPNSCETESKLFSQSLSLAVNVTSYFIS